MKKFLFSISALLLCRAQMMAYDFMVGGLAYNKLTDSTVEVIFKGSNYNSGKDYTDAAYVIPSTVTNDGVTYTVTKIGDSAFYGSSVQSIYVPESVTVIDNYSFGLCRSLKELTLPSGITQFPNYALPLSNSSALEKLTINCDPQKVEGKIFTEAGSLPKLKELVFGPYLREVSAAAVSYWANGVQTLTIAAGEGTLKCDPAAFERWTMTTVNFNRPVEMTVPDNASNIDEIHIADIAPFTTVTIPSVNYSTTKLYVNGSRLAEYRSTEPWSNFSSIEAEPGTEVIEDHTYGFNFTLNEEARTAEIIAAGDAVDPYTGDIVIPETLTVGGKDYTVTSIGKRAFNSTGITSLKLPATIKEIKQGAFQMCYDLASVELNEGLEKLSYDVFNNTKALETITIPGSIKTIPFNAFGNSGLKSVIVNSGVEKIEAAFTACENLTSISLPETLVELDGTFEDCTALTEITLPESLRTIGWFTFANTGITELVINEGIKTLDMQSLGMMNGDYNADYTLKKVTLPSTLKEINAMAFNNRRGLTDVIVRATVPPTAGDFAEYVYAATLTVPEGTLAAYKAADSWKNFSKIKETDKVTSLDIEKLRYTVGEGSNKYVLRVSFNNTRRLDNLTWGYLTDETSAEPSAVLAAVAEADKRLNVVSEGDNTTISFDLISDGEINERDVTATGKWTVSSNSLAADGTSRIIVFEFAGSDNGLDYDFFVPEPDAEGVWLPEEMSVKLSDEGSVLPALVQVPDGKLNSSSNWQASSSNTSYKLDRTKITTPYTLVDETFNAIPTFTGATGTTYVRYRPQKVGEYAYYESNFMTLNIEAPEVPVTSITVAEENVTAGLNKAVTVDYTFEPANATYTAVKFTPADTRIATWSASAGLKTTATAGETTVTVASLFDPEVKTAFNLRSELLNPVTAVNFGPDTEDGVINVPVRQLIGLKPIVLPADADIPDVTIELSDNGTSKDDYTCSTYKVNWWDVNNVRSQFYELSGHRPTGDRPAKLHVKSADGAYERDFVVNVIEADRTPRENGYVDGTIILNEEWFGHTNGGLNYFTEDDEIIYQVYEKENPGMAFGATSQYGTIWAGKLIVASKQAKDGGDPLPGGGRLVIADAKTLKRLGSLDNLTWDGASGDGRAVAGATPDKIYVGSSNGIYIVDISDPENPVITGRIGKENSTDLYSGQIGDMTNACGHVFAVMQGGGLIIINVNDDTTTNISDANIQGVTQSADGNVWYATAKDGCSVFVALDPETLEEVDRVTMPSEIGVVACGWGAWRSTAFHGSPKTNDLWFVTGAAGIMGGASGDYYRYHIGDSPADIKPFFSLSNVTGVNGFGEEVGQMTYGTPRYDDRNDRLVVMAGRKSAASGGYRDHWVHYVDGTTGEITRTFHLNPYYWFQSLPIFPDKYEAAIDLDNMDLKVEDGAEEIDLTEFVTDADNIDSNIRLWLADEPTLPEGEEPADKVIDVTLEGRKLTVTPWAAGTGCFTLVAESNGRVSSKTLTVNVTDESSSIDKAAADHRSITCNGRRIEILGFAGEQFRIFDMTGRMVTSFDVDTDRYVLDFGSHTGIYVVSSESGINAKVIIR